jgi:hypothetical protein
LLLNTFVTFIRQTDCRGNSPIPAPIISRLPWIRKLFITQLLLFVSSLIKPFGLRIVHKIRRSISRLTFVNNFSHFSCTLSTSNST